MNYSEKKQADICPFPISLSSGVEFLQISVEYLHLGWKLQPEGGFEAFATSPWSISGLNSELGKGWGNADKSAFVYGCFGEL